jgi:PAS domain S-box-containing protein
MADNRSTTFQEELTTANGEVTFLATKGPLHDDAGNVIGLFGIARDITERRQAEEALRKSEEHYRSLFDNMLNGFAYCRMLFERNRPNDFIYLSVNSAFEALTGLKNVIGKKVSEVIPGIQEDDPELFEIYGRVASTGIPERFETCVKALEMWFSISVYSPQKEHFVAVFDVITERKRAEQTLRESLAEKVALLKEIHHRVKNNLQIVASRLNLQARRVQDKNAVNILRDTRGRVHSMALLHEMLYHSGNLAQINFVVYVEELCGQLKRSFGSSAARVSVAKRVARISLPLEQSLPCGLIISELVSNALKHGFPGKREGTVTVELRPGEGQSLVLSVSDDGVGLPTGLDILNSSTMGLQLVSNLAAQLKGQFAVGRTDGGGTTISVVFPIPEDTLHEGEE